MRPVREQLSAAVGSTQLPWFYAATFIVTLALAPVFGALVVALPAPDRGAGGVRLLHRCA